MLCDSAAVRHNLILMNLTGDKIRCSVLVKFELIQWYVCVCYPEEKLVLICPWLVLCFF